MTVKQLIDELKRYPEDFSVNIPNDFFGVEEAKHVHSGKYKWVEMEMRGKFIPEDKLEYWQTPDSVFIF